jgi:hypothetical protein
LAEDPLETYAERVDAVLREEIRDEVRREMERVYHRAFVKVVSRTLWVLQATLVIFVVALKL